MIQSQIRTNPYIIVDPALFLFDSSKSGGESNLRRLLNDALQVLHICHGQIPAVSWYWEKIQKELIKPLYAKVMDRETKVALDRFRDFAKPATFPQARPVEVWGLRGLFTWELLPHEWLRIMEQVFLGCALASEPSLFLCRLFPGRNALWHHSGESILIEKTCWQVTLRVNSHLKVIPCVRNPRNIDVPFTRRVDERLPAEFDGAKYPYCPPQEWDASATQLIRTRAGKQSWIDRNGRCWAPPATPGTAYHWDVLLSDRHEIDRIGLEQLNIVAFGAPSAQGRVGDIHHLPEKKKSKLKADPGWRC